MSCKFLKLNRLPKCQPFKISRHPQYRDFSKCEKVLNNTDVHNAAEIQSKWYPLWQKKLTEYNNKTDRKIYSILFPPPNVTGNLHLGHAITCTIQDAIVRW